MTTTEALGAPAADAIVVLGARVNADGSPGSDLTSRTYHAVDLWLAGYAPHIICTGGFKNERLSAAAVCRRFAIELGVPADRIVLADGSSNTIEDAAATAQVMADQGWRKAILVSHPLHLYRARWLFRRAGLDVVTSPTSTDVQRIAPPVRAWYADARSGRDSHHRAGRLENRAAGMDRPLTALDVSIAVEWKLEAGSWKLEAGSCDAGTLRHLTPDT